MAGGLFWVHTLSIFVLIIIIFSLQVVGEPSVVSGAGSASSLPLEPATQQRQEDLAILGAATQGKLHELQQAIFAGANLEARDSKEGNTPLIWAAFSGHLHIVQELVNKRADINAESLDSHKSALLMAAYSGHDVIVEYLLFKGANIDHANSRGDTGVAIAAYMNRAEVVEVLLHHRANLKKRTKSQHYQPLHLAAYKGHSEIVLMLLDHYKPKEDTAAAAAVDGELDMDARDKQGNSPLLLAVMQGQTEAARVLLQAGADATLTDNMGNTVLMLAVNRGHLETMLMLLEWLQQRGDGQRPGDDSGVLSEHSLLSSPAVLWQIDKANSDGQTPMLRACIKGFTPLFKELLKRGANLEHKDNSNNVCEDVAREKGWKEIQRLILEYKKDYPLNVEL